MEHTTHRVYPTFEHFLSDLRTGPPDLDTLLLVKDDRLPARSAMLHYVASKRYHVSDATQWFAAMREAIAELDSDPGLLDAYVMRGYARWDTMDEGGTSYVVVAVPVSLCQTKALNEVWGPEATPWILTSEWGFSLDPLTERAVSAPGATD